MIEQREQELIEINKSLGKELAIKNRELEIEVA